MRNYFLFLMLLFSSFQTHAQNDSLAIKKDSSQTENLDIVLSYTNHMPTFKANKYKDFQEYILDNIKYPKEAQALKIQGVVYIQYTIELDGSVSNVHVLPGKGLYPSCDQEAIDIISNSPKWEPGRQNDIPVRVQLIIPIRYTLINSKRKK
jgi:protein TonB